jgi:eukaryotic-like serine/threonine-protein kinase
MAGDWLGRYALVRLLGSGGMADVHLARATGEAGFEKPVALKVLHANLARRDDAVAYFLDEARLASKLIHPNIVQILDLGRAGDAYFIAMELIDGSDLDHVLRSARAAGRPVPIGVAMTILRKMCDGLNAAHTAIASDGQPLLMVHRDVKSGNVLVSRDGIVKIADFGIVKASQQLHVTAVGQATGTPAVMAPEQRMGGAIDRRADVYGVGAVAYEILTGREVNLDLVMLMPRGIEGWPHLPPPSHVRPELPAELDRLVLACLAFDPEHRPGSCEIVEHELEQIAARYGWLASDKEVARWMVAELAAMPPRIVASQSDAVA